MKSNPMFSFAPLPQLHQFLLQGAQVSIDSRTIQVGDLFFALDGPHFQGTDFIEEALHKGASYAITHDTKWQSHPKVVLVENSLDALQSLALWYRKTLSIRTLFIAITGSNGKTTTKELTRAVLAEKYHCTATAGNLNNHIGVPLTLLHTPLDTDIAIIEMGANHKGEIMQYCQMVLPRYGLITNISNAHIGEFGSMENIMQAKGELYDFLKQQTNSFIFVNQAHAALYARAQQSELPLLCYAPAPYPGVKITGEVVSSSLDAPLRVRLYEEDEEKNTHSYMLNTQLFGTFNLENIIAAFRIGRHFQVPVPNIIHAIETYLPQQHRSQIVKKDQLTFIVDAYNANPQSMRLAIENIQGIQDKDKILILGSMQELGKHTQKEHAKIIQQTARSSWYKVFLIGEEWRTTKYPANYVYFNKTATALKAFEKLSLPSACILLKGSRKHQLEQFIQAQPV